MCLATKTVQEMTTWPFRDTVAFGRAILIASAPLIYAALAQLINVLWGNMSLVGPRAMLREQVETFGVHTSTVLSMKPGLTGLWAVSGRSDIAQEARALLEYRYVTEWSFLLDLRILIRTIPAVVRGHGAY